MAKQFRCLDIGAQCAFEATADNREELVPKIAAHVKSAHGIQEVAGELAVKVQNAIKEK